MMSGFTFSNYARLLDALQETGAPLLRVRDHIASPPDGAFVMIRHDVEWGVKRSMIAAEMEAERGMQATYYFHGPHRRKVFVPEAMQAMMQLGHEVGYHYETLDLCDGDYDAAESLFAEQLQAFRDAGIEIRTVCQHGNPRKKKVGYTENADLFRHRMSLLCDQYDLLGEAYCSVDFEHLTYISDVGVRFANMGESCRALIERLEAMDTPRLYLLTHPDYWSRSRFRATSLSSAGRVLRALQLNKLISTVRAIPKRHMKDEA